MIDQNKSAKCPWCNTATKLDIWDELSKSFCHSREQRRAFKSITDPVVWKKNSKTHYYKCPNCGQWSAGCKLRLIDTDNTEVEGFGGDPLFEIMDKGDNIDTD
jgi:hypothetical protein